MSAPADRQPHAKAAAAPVAGTRPDPAAADAAPGARRPRWDSARLFGAADEIEIVHRDAVYRMRITSLGKLILTK